MAEKFMSEILSIGYIVFALYVVYYVCVESSSSLIYLSCILMWTAHELSRQSESLIFEIWFWQCYYMWGYNSDHQRLISGILTLKSFICTLSMNKKKVMQNSLVLIVLKQNCLPLKDLEISPETTQLWSELSYYIWMADICM